MLQSLVQPSKDIEKMAPKLILEKLMEGNRRFIEGRSIHERLIDGAKATVHEQQPYAIVLSCMDSRSVPEHVFDQGIGEILTVRIAGNIVSREILGSLEFGVEVLGAKVVFLLGHTGCGAVSAAVQGGASGAILSALERIDPAVIEAKKLMRAESEIISEATKINVRNGIDQIKVESPFLRELEQSGRILIVGGIHHLQSGKVKLIVS